MRFGCQKAEKFEYLWLKFENTNSCCVSFTRWSAANPQSLFGTPSSRTKGSLKMYNIFKNVKNVLW